MNEVNDVNTMVEEDWKEQKRSWQETWRAKRGESGEIIAAINGDSCSRGEESTPRVRIKRDTSVNGGPINFPSPLSSFSSL